MSAALRSQGSLSEQAYQMILDHILSGDLALGSVLSRRNLAAEFGMSLLPVSEALQRLEADGLVESKPRVGTRVRVPTHQDIRGHYIVREALESQAARLFAEKASPGERRELLGLARQLDQEHRATSGGAVNAQRLFDIHRLHARLHRRIAECTGCQPLCDAIEKNHILIFNWLYDIASERRKFPPRWHQTLIQTISRGKILDADEAMRRHVRYGMEETLDMLDLQPGQNMWRQKRSFGDRLRNP